MIQPIVPRMRRRNILPPAAPAVYIAGRRRYDLAVRRWESAPGPRFDVVTLTAPWSCSDDWSAAPPIGAAVRVVLAGAVFEGVVTEHGAAIDGRRDEIEVIARHNLWRLLARPVRGLWRRDADEAVWLADGPVRFDHRAHLASPQPVPVGPRRVKVFDDSPKGVYWSLAEVLDYLLGAYGQDDLAAPGIDELNRLAGAAPAPAMDLTGATLRDALARAAEAAGLWWRSDPQAPTVLTLVRAGQGPTRRLHLPPRGGTVAASRSPILSVRRRRGEGARPTVAARGRRELLEWTLEFSPGWPAELTPKSFRQSVISRSEYPEQFGDFGREWILNETGRYGEAPSFSFASIDAQRFALDRPRRLRPCVSTDESGAGRGVVIEISTDAAASWRRYGGPVRLSDVECSLRLAPDELDGAWFAACRRGDARLRVTAAVEADTRVEARIEGDPRAPVEVMDADWARREIVSPLSIFHGDGQGDEIVRDDSERLLEAARLRNRSAAPAGPWTVTLGAVDVSFAAGDAVVGEPGRAILQTAGAAVVERVVHRFDRRQSTELHIRGGNGDG